MQQLDEVDLKEPGAGLPKGPNTSTAYPTADLPAENIPAMADNKQQQPGVGQHQQAKRQPGIEQPDEVQLQHSPPLPRGR